MDIPQIISILLLFFSRINHNSSSPSNSFFILSSEEWNSIHIPRRQFSRRNNDPYVRLLLSIRNQSGDEHADPRPSSNRIARGPARRASNSCVAVESFLSVRGCPPFEIPSFRLDIVAQIAMLDGSPLHCYLARNDLNHVQNYVRYRPIPS
jgi:ankyrin repeat protein